MPHKPNFPASPSLAQVPASTPRTVVHAVLAASLLALCPLAQAQSDSPEPAYGMSGRLGLGVATVPTYEGSPNRRTKASANSDSCTGGRLRCKNSRWLPSRNPEKP